MFVNVSSFRHQIFISLVCLTSFTSTALAQALQTDAIVVTATRFAASIDTAAVNITTITAEDIARSNATTIADVLRYQAGISVTELFGMSGSRAKIDLGGFGANSAQNTLILLNGRRLNDLDLAGPNLASIPLGNIAQLEIIHGSSSVLYGDNAVGGVINIVTNNAFNEQRGSIKLQAGSFQTQRLAINQSKLIGETAISFAFDVSKSDGYRKNNASDGMNLMTEASRENTDWLYGARINASREQLQLPGSLGEPAYITNPESSTSQEKSEEARNALEVFMEGDRFATELALQNKHQGYVSGSYQSHADLNTLSFTPRFKKQYDKHHLVVGMDLYNSNLDATTSYNSRNVNQKSRAIYATDSISLGQSTSLGLGVRHELITVTAKNVSNERSDHIDSWDINLRHQYSNGMNNYVRLAKSFRSAVLDEMWDYFTGKFSFIKPQSGHHIEIGARQNLNNGLKLSANLFRTNLTDEIAYDNATFSNVNLDKTRHDGANLNLDAPIGDNINLQAGYAWRKATFRSGTNSGNTIPAVPQHKLTLAGQYQLDDKRQMSLNAIHTGKRFFGDDNTNSGKQMPAYTRLDANYTQKFTDWKGRIQVKNLTNINVADSGFYRSVSPNYYYYPLPERSIYFTIEGKL